MTPALRAALETLEIADCAVELAAKEAEYTERRTAETAERLNAARSGQWHAQQAILLLVRSGGAE